SSPMVAPLSTPPNAKAIVDQKMTSLKLVLGTMASAVSGVADPNRIHEIAPSTINTVAEAQPAIAPALLSHLPTSRPTTLSVTVTRRPAIATAMKYELCEASGCHDAPPMKSAFAAAK